MPFLFSVILRRLAHRAYLIKNSLEFTAAVSASAVFDIGRLLRFEISGERPVILLQLVVFDIEQLGTVEKSRGIFFVLVRIAAAVQLSIALKGYLFKPRAIGKSHRIDRFDAFGDKELLQSRAPLERLISDESYRFGDIYAVQSLAVAESTHADPENTVSVLTVRVHTLEFYLLQSRTLSEGEVFNGLDL